MAPRQLAVCACARAPGVCPMAADAKGPPTAGDLNGPASAHRAGLLTADARRGEPALRYAYRAPAQPASSIRNCGINRPLCTARTPLKHDVYFMFSSQMKVGLYFRLQFFAGALFALMCYACCWESRRLKSCQEQPHPRNGVGLLVLGWDRA